MKYVRLLLLIGTALLLGGCSGQSATTLHCAKGHLQLMNSAQPIAGLIADPQTDPQLRTRLEKVSEMREFAVDELGLPTTTVIAAMPISAGRSWSGTWSPPRSSPCSPGNGAFRSQAACPTRATSPLNQAEQQAARLREQHLDVDLYGVPAYSTLNWFADPVLNTFIAAPEARLAGLLFHELAHQLNLRDRRHFLQRGFCHDPCRSRGYDAGSNSMPIRRTGSVTCSGKEQNSRFQDFLRTNPRAVGRTLTGNRCPESQMRTEKQPPDRGSIGTLQTAQGRRLVRQRLRSLDVPRPQQCPAGRNRHVPRT